MRETGSRRNDQVKFISWNVNGLRAVLKKGFLDFVAAEKPDFLCLQETRLGQDVSLEVLPEYEHQFWNHAEKAGYSGTAIFTRHKPLAVHYGIGKKKHDQEGRVITLEYETFQLLTVYTPNAGIDDCARLPYRVEWDKDFLAYVRKLTAEKPLIFCGDLNVAHTEIDLARPKQNRGRAGFTDEERAGFENMLGAGFLDTFREFSDAPEQYTWWSFRAGARKRNVGWRIDYFLIDRALRPKLKGASILADVLGSDHCPVAIELKT